MNRRKFIIALSLIPILGLPFKASANKYKEMSESFEKARQACMEQNFVTFSSRQEKGCVRITYLYADGTKKESVVTQRDIEEFGP